MACTEPLQDLPIYLSGALTPEGERRLREHIGGCVACQERLSDLLRPPWEAMEAALLAELDAPTLSGLESEPAQPAAQPAQPAGLGAWARGAVPVRRASLLAYAAVLAMALLWSPDRAEAPRAAHAADAVAASALIEPEAPPAETSPSSDRRDARPAVLQTATYLPHHGSL